METLVRTTNGVDIDGLHATIQAINENPSIADFKFMETNKCVNGAQKSTTSGHPG